MPVIAAGMQTSTQEAFWLLLPRFELQVSHVAWLASLEVLGAALRTGAGHVNSAAGEADPVYSIATHIACHDRRKPLTIYINTRMSKRNHSR